MSLKSVLLYTPDAFVASPNFESTQAYQGLKFSYTKGFWYNVLIYAAMFILLTTGYSVQFFQRLIPTLKIVRDKEMGNFICQVTGTVNCFYISLTSVVAIWRLYDSGSFILGVSMFLSVGQVMIGYLIVDTIYKILYSGQPAIWVLGHHVAAFAVTVLAALDSNYLMEKYLLCLMECSNPFINMRIVLSILSYSKNTVLYKANAIGMTGSFLIARVLPSFYFIPRGLFILAYLDNYSAFQASMFAGYLVISAMNYYWFYRMVRGIYIALFRGKIE